jgi:hypothetical protein
MTTLKFKDAGDNATGAAINAFYHNRMNSATYTSVQRASAQTVIDLFDLAYSFKDAFKNFRKTFIAIKFDSARVCDKKRAAMIDEIIKERGYIKVETAQGIIVRIPRAVA